MPQSDDLLALELAITGAWRRVQPAFDNLWACAETACRILERGERPTPALAARMQRAIDRAKQAMRATHAAIAKASKA